MKCAFLITAADLLLYTGPLQDLIGLALLAAAVVLPLVLNCMTRLSPA